MLKLNVRSVARSILLLFIVLAILSGPCLAVTKPKKITISLEWEPPQLDSTKTADAASYKVLGHIMEGLTRFDKHSNVIPGIATHWITSKDSMTFYLRKNALWSNGEPVTAHDFVFAWRKVVDPKNASSYSFSMYPIKNAEAINTKKIKDLTQLGVKALDDYTLNVSFETPCAYFASLTAFSSFLPVKESFYKSKGEKYAADANDLLFNGPFKLTKWNHGAALRFERNEKYYNQSQTNLDIIDVPYIISEKLPTFNLFRDKKIDIAPELDKDTYRLAQQQGLQLIPFSEGAGVYILFNHDKSKLTSNLNLRKAIAEVIDAEEYVNKIVALPGNKAMHGLVPSCMPGAKLRFRQEFRLHKTKPDLQKAKLYLHKALQELNLSKPPELSLLIDDFRTLDAEYFQYVLRKNLGINVKIDKQIFKQRLAKANAGDFDMVYWLWGPDYLDPMTFIESLLSSWNPNNVGKFYNDEIDKEIKKAQATVNAAVRMPAMANSEKMALGQAALVPLYERAKLYVKKDELENVIMTPVGFNPNFTQAFLRE